jgi:hypothetical protein
MSELELITEIAKGYNNLDISIIEKVVSPGIIYEQQGDLFPIEGWSDVKSRLGEFFEATSKSKFLVYAELGYWGSKSCIRLSRGSKELKNAVLLIAVINGRVGRIFNSTTTPHWMDVIGSNLYPK